MPAPEFSLEVSGSNPKSTTVAALTTGVNAVAQALFDQIGAIATGLEPAGNWSAASGSFPSGSTKGSYYVVSAAGTVGGQAFAVGDWLVPLKDNASTATYAANWFRADYSKIVPREYKTVTGVNGLVSSLEANRGVGAEWRAKGFRYEELPAGTAASLIHLTTAGGVLLKYLPDATINVMAYGATGDGVTDDAAAIQRAFDHASAISTDTSKTNVAPVVRSNFPGVEVIFPAGKYRVRSQVVIAASRMTLTGQNSLIFAENGDIASGYPVKFTGAYRSFVKGMSFASGENGCIDVDAPNISSAIMQFQECTFIGNRGNAGNIARGVAIRYKNRSSTLVVKDCLFNNVKHPFDHIEGDAVSFIDNWYDLANPTSYADDEGYFNNIRGEFLVEGGIWAAGPANSGTRVAYFNCTNPIDLTIRKTRIAFEDGGAALINWKVPIDLVNGSSRRSGFILEDVALSPRGENETFHYRTATPAVRLYTMPNKMVFRNLSWRNTIQGLIAPAPTTTLETLYQAARAQLDLYNQTAYSYEGAVGNEMYFVATADKLVHKKWLALFDCFNFSFETDTAGSQLTHTVRTYYTGSAAFNAGSYEVAAQCDFSAETTSFTARWLVSVTRDNSTGDYGFASVKVSNAGPINTRDVTFAPKFRRISDGVMADNIAFADAPNYEIAFQLTSNSGARLLRLPVFYARPIHAMDVAKPHSGKPRQFFYAST